MNSEELEMSLRIEFESHLKNVVANMRQEFSQFQEKVNAELDKHKSQLDEVFQEFSGRLENNTSLEAGFAENVVEHLRLARDEGARITAEAFGEAEKLREETDAAAAPTVGISELRDAINDITAQNSQATILKSLVQHAAQFTPRGAFFIIKNEHFVGWRVFGKEGDTDEHIVREVFFPVASSTALGESVRSLSAVESSFGSYDDDSIYLNKLEFGHPDRMYAIPLIARGRGVAVLYADYGKNGEPVNVEALETLVRVAGLTVEVLAAVPTSQFGDYAQPVADYSDDPEAVPAESFEESEASGFGAADEYQTVSEEPTEEAEAVESDEFASQPVSVADEDSVEEVSEPEAVSVEEEADEAEAWSQPVKAEVEETEEETDAYQPVISDDYSTSVENDYQLRETTEAEEIEPEITATPSFEPIEEVPVEDESPSDTLDEFVPAPAVSEPVSAAPVKSRFSDRNVDLPIEVSEDERRLHNDARRFARLLVSEIKLYNEQKVKEGRESQDLYERLREAIDRSRDMYDKRVQPPVAAKFDYFHYELVSSLAEGEENKLGGAYPGATI